MYTNRFRLQAKDVGEGQAQIKALVHHPNHNGLGRTEQGDPIPPHHLTRLVLAVNGVPRLTLYTGSGIAANPLLGWKIAARRGDRVSLTWHDTQEDSQTAETIVS